jgi:hypothetical protein
LLPVVALGAAAATAVPMTADAATTATATTTPPPAYTTTGTAQLNDDLLSDIAGSAFVGADGQFHWTNGDTPYDTNPADAWANTFTNTDMGAVNAGVGTTTGQVTADAYYGDPGSICYQVDKSATHPIPSPQEDDHCDVVGVWVDPASGTWHAILNDEYQFDPWGVTGPTSTTAQKIATGLHNDRILLATSRDQGKSWQYAGPALTSAWDDDQVVDSTSSPGTTYPFGDSGCRLFVDYSTGYFYITYNVKIYKKPYASTVASWTEMARAPIGGGMASGTWQKWYDGSWSQPGVGGIDGNVGSVGGLNVSYSPDTDSVAWNGSGRNKSASYQSTNVPSTHLIVFSDGEGDTYTANTLAHTIVDNATGASMTQGVSYTDPVTGQNMNILAVPDQYVNGQKITGGIRVTETDPASGASNVETLITGSQFYQDPNSQLIYIPAQNNESAISYDAYSQTYRIVGYDGNVYETTNLGDPDSWKAVGLSPSGSDGGYLTTLDDGSLTNQNVTGRSFLTISDLSGAVYDVDQAAASDPAGLSAERKAVDTAGRTVDATTPYVLRIGGMAVNAHGGFGLVGGYGIAAGSSAWQLVPVADPSSPGDDSGFYRLVNPATGQDLQISGDTAAAQRAMGAVATVGAQLPDGTPLSSSSMGTPGGSDQWYLQAVATHGTSIARSTTYRLVNRNSGLALEFVRGRLRLEQQAPGDPGQYVTLSAR